MRMIFVNLPVRNVEASKAFFAALDLGFSFNPDFSDEQSACMVITDTIFVMLLEHEKFQGFINTRISDAHTETEVLTCLSATSRAEVDATLANALAAGGKPWKPIMEFGPMYGCSFQDLDGHVWEMMYMDQHG
ncbi:VOC family protein [Pararhizobium sp.]|uniref:VOC family protein n=1 Tax=Pararhizobium sp. TaxID=1977563 RepID=UPI00271FE4F9|nr:VOC family protein [Pararhizobium sp.]MDO9417207.1 VOC family protein [Pararhizobium sp.]